MYPKNSRAKEACAVGVVPSCDAVEERLAFRWCVVILVLGVGWRVLRFWLCMPVWGDEAFLALNFLDRDFLTILKPLDYTQVAPPLFLIGEMGASRLWGAGEFALRLLPLLASVGAVVVFWRWCCRVLTGYAVPLALAFFALGYYPARYGVEIKPYGCDQLAAVVLLFLATAWLFHPEQRRWLWFFAMSIPLALLCSYPAVFVAGGCMLAFAFSIYQRRDVRALPGFLVSGLVTVAAFVFLYWLVGSGQYEQTGTPMREYWRDAFPPRDMGLLKWLLDAHTGNMFAYPVGGKNYGSTATFLLFIVGAVWCWRHRTRALSVALFMPFVLTFVAAWMERYPYGGSARVAQHLAPVICLLAGAGVYVLMRRFCRSERGYRMTAACVLSLFCLVAVLGIVRDVQKPYKTKGDAEVREWVLALEREAGKRVPVIVAQPMRSTPVNEQYYLRMSGMNITWDGQASGALLDLVSDEVIVINFDPNLVFAPSAAAAAKASAAGMEGKWTMQSEQTLRIVTHPTEPYAQITRWVRVP